ncbi:hypothetical protein GGS20DRAFT_568227 [Poronia punctata]|nr:hypothetical protein GGS20DRAFT_568227 [Poronia punctata]
MSFPVSFPVSPPYKILIFGATGTIGKYISNAIISADPPVGDDISIFTSDATSRSPDKQALLSSWKSRGVRVLTGDVSDAARVSRVMDGVEVVVSCLGRNALAAQTELLRLAEQSPSVKWFFPSEYGTDIEYDASSRGEKPHQLKLKVRDFIRENLERVRCTHLVTGPYVDMYLDLVPNQERLGGYDVKLRVAHVIGDGNGPVGFTSMPDVGKLLVAALRHPREAMGKVLKVQSFVTTPLAIAQEFEQQMGEKWTVRHTTIEEIRQLEAQLWDDESPAATAATLRRIWAEGRTLYEETDNQRLGLGSEDMESLSTVVGRAIASLSGK